MKEKKIVLLAVFILLLSCSALYMHRPMTQKNATKRAEAFITAVNENKPELIYDYLTPSIRQSVSKESFVENFAKERSYPYLTPLYLYLDHINFHGNQTHGIITCTVASRLPGEKIHFEIVFTDNNYYIYAFKDVADGSFIKKFEKL